MPIGITLMAIGAGAQVVSGLIATKRANDMASDNEALLSNIEDFERQPITNPYSDVQAYQYEDLSDTFNNPYNNLKVATQAAEFQAQQTDQALANTLDTLRSGGMGAGGATALAQAAAQSKQGISASIEQQEVQNQKLRAQGEEALQQRIVSEKSRVQAGEAAEAGRVQQLVGRGKELMFNAQEDRDNIELDRMQALYDNAQAQQQQYRNDASAAFTGAVSSLGGIGGSMMAQEQFDAQLGAGMFNTPVNNTSTSNFQFGNNYGGYRPPLGSTSTLLNK